MAGGLATVTITPADGKEVKLAFTAPNLVASEYRWIVLADASQVRIKGADLDGAGGFTNLTVAI